MMNVLRRITRSTLSLTAAAMLLCTAMPTAERKASAWAADGKVLGVTNSVKEKALLTHITVFMQEAII